MAAHKTEMPTEEELLMVDEFLRLRGSSLKKTIKRIVEATPEEPLCLCFKGMKFNELTKSVIRNAAEHPDRLGIETYNSFEEYKKAMEAYCNAD